MTKHKEKQKISRLEKDLMDAMPSSDDSISAIKEMMDQMQGQSVQRVIVESYPACNSN